MTDQPPARDRVLSIRVTPTGLKAVDKLAEELGRTRSDTARLMLQAAATGAGLDIVHLYDRQRKGTRHG